MNSNGSVNPRKPTILMHLTEAQPLPLAANPEFKEIAEENGALSLVFPKFAGGTYPPEVTVNTQSKEVTLNFDRSAVQILLPLVKTALRSSRARMGFYRNKYNSNPARAAKAEAETRCLLVLFDKLEAISLEPWFALREEEKA